MSVQQEIYIAGCARTPVGSFNGKLSSFPAPKLGSIAIEEALKRANISKDKVDEVIMGNVLTAGVGQAPSRQAALGAGLPNSVCCTTINKVCGSGLKAVMLASQNIMCGESDIVAAGGMENMTLAPHLLEKSREGYRMGEVKLSDSMIKDGLWDVYNNFHMGSAAELCAKEYGFTREMQDKFAIESYTKALNAQKEGRFKEEIVAVSIPQKKGSPVLMMDDEEPLKCDFQKIPALKSAFQKDGTITAANASSINDGAAAHIIISKEKMEKLGIRPMAKILGFRSAARAPEWFTTAPADAIKYVLDDLKLKPQDIDLYEINEAFAVVTMAAIKEFNLDMSKVNVNGGSVAIGHPIGASGARILVTLLYAMKNRNARLGLATLCIGGGEAVAMVVENTWK